MAENSKPESVSLSVNSLEALLGQMSSVIEALKPKPRSRKNSENGGQPAVKVPKMALLHQAVVDAFTRAPHTKMTPPRVEFKVYQPTGGPRQIVQIMPNNTCRKVTLDHVVDEISIYTTAHAAETGDTNFAWVHKEHVSCAKSLISRSEPIEEPKPYVFSNEPEKLGFCRLGFALQEYPTLELATKSDEFLSRTSDRDAVLYWIGSLFVEGSYRQGYLVLMGDGRDGKGSFMAGIIRAMGTAAVSLDDLPRDKHWGTVIENKRLVVFTDLENVGLINTARFKAMTGGDDISVRPLFAPAYQASLQALTAIVTNHNSLPLSSQRHSTERPLIVKVRPPNIDPDELNDTYREELWAEVEVLIGHAVYKYRTEHVHGKKIRGNEETKATIADMAGENEDEFESLAHAHFLFGDALSIRSERYQDILTSLFGRGNRNEDKNAFRSYLKRKYSVKIAQAPARGAPRPGRWNGLAPRYPAASDHSLTDASLDQHPFENP